MIYGYQFDDAMPPKVNGASLFANHPRRGSVNCSSLNNGNCGRESRPAFYQLLTNTDDVDVYRKLEPWAQGY